MPAWRHYCPEIVAAVLVTAGSVSLAAGQDISYPPKLPGDRPVVTDTSDEFLEPISPLADDVRIATAAPTIDFLYYPAQTYPAKTWSVWGDGSVRDGKYYSAIGDHDAPAGNAFVYEYDSKTKTLRTLLDLKGVLNLPDGHYSPSKIHTRIDVGRDGWVYFATHRGSTKVTTDEYHFKGDWIIRHHPATGQTEVLARGPVAQHSIPTGMLDPDRLIFYGGTTPGAGDGPIMFFAFDVKKRKVLHAVPDGPYRYLILARSSGRVYYVNRDGGRLMRYDPATNEPPVQIEGTLGLRAATHETADGFVYTVSTRGSGTLWRFNTRTEQIEELGPAAVGSQTYVTSLDVDPSGRYLYYIPGAHGGSQTDGCAVVQFDTHTRKKTVIAFLHPFYQKKYGYVPLGTFSSAVNADGDTLYITWNGSRSEPDRRGRYRWDACALSVIHVPPSER